MVYIGFQDGSIYIGEWKDDEKHGQGTYTYLQGGKYIGGWKKDQKHGQGSLTLSDGDKYIGSFKDNNFTGQGTLTILDGGDFADREEYVGAFKDDEFNGQGTYTVYSNGNIKSVRSGIWKDGKLVENGDAEPAITSQDKTDDNEMISASSGSGFAVSEDGYVVTNHHVIEGCQKVLVHSKEQSVQAIIVTSDPQNDLALLKADFKPDTVFPLSADRPELLQDIYVAGYPFGKNISSSVKVTKGIISSLTGIGNNFSNIQIDAALQPGNSGGPILDEKGNVVGVAVAKLDAELILENFGSLPEDTNFGIKSNIVKNILDSNGVDGPQANQDEISKTKAWKDDFQWHLLHLLLDDDGTD